MLTTVGPPPAPVVPILGAAGEIMRRRGNALLGGVLLATYTMMEGIGVRSGGHDRRHISRR